MTLIPQTEEERATPECFDCAEAPENEFDTAPTEQEEENWYPSYFHWNGCLRHHEPS